MQKANADIPITITGRHDSATEAIREHARKKMEGLHLDYPRIIEAKVILDVDHNAHICEIILFCANHIHIEAKTETDNLYASIDETASKIARRMRKHKTRLLKSHRPRERDIRHLEEIVFPEEVLDDLTKEEVEPVIVHKENFRIRPLRPDEAIMDLELSERPFVAFHNENSDKLAIVYRRGDGDYGMIEP